jgi:cyclase
LEEQGLIMEIPCKDIYVETRYLAPNVGCVVTGGGCILIDSPFLPDEAQHWCREVNKLSENGIAYLINTDHHFDHMMGNCFLSTRVIAHKVAYRGFKYYQNRRNLMSESNMFFPKYKENWEEYFGKVEIHMPQIVFLDELSLYLEGTEVQTKFVGGHSPATIFIYIPSMKVLFSGDNIENGRHPAMVYSRFDVWINALKTIEGMEVDIIVPGHGPVGQRDIATKQRQYFEEMVRYGKSLKAEGINREEFGTRIAKHMLDYLAPPKGEEDRSRELVRNGARRLFDQL